jgi:hypothetical protein
MSRAILLAVSPCFDLDVRRLSTSFAIATRTEIEWDSTPGSTSNTNGLLSALPAFSTSAAGGLMDNTVTVPSRMSFSTSRSTT